MDLEELISAYKTSQQVFESGLKREVRNVRIPLRDKDKCLLVLVALEGMPLHLTRETMQSYSHDHIVQLLRSEEMVLIPLKAKDKVIGIVVADNFITRDPITKNDIRMLTLLANQAGLAIEDSQLYEKTVLRAHTDSLTELWNHGYFQYLLQSELEKAKAQQKPLSLITLDIDDFKIYNDTLGHQAGDQILKDLASVLKDQSRKMDHVCRYGGEEFTVILPHTDNKEAFQISERLRETIKIFPFSHEEILPSKHLTVSIGLATYPENGVTSSELITASDKALYQAKHKGKNNTCCVIKT
jgi:diguanylate cyclase (GGDEF)-like protein